VRVEQGRLAVTPVEAEEEAEDLDALERVPLAAVLALATNIGSGPWQTRPSCSTSAWPGRPSGTCAPTPWRRPPQRSSPTSWPSPSRLPGGTYAQPDQANALNFVTAAVTCWNTVYIAEVVGQLRPEGWEVSD
jgi:hypothetical protein